MEASSPNTRPKKMKARIALALSRANLLRLVLDALLGWKRYSNTNPQLGAQLQFFDGAADLAAGTYLVVAMFSVDSVSAPSLTMAAKLRVDGASLVAPAPQMGTFSGIAGHTVCANVLPWIVTIAGAGLHSVGVQVDAGGGNTSAVAAAGQMTIIALPLPAAP